MAKIILTQEVSGLGAAGDVVTVKDGYARNYLLPRGFAVTWTQGGEKQVESIRAARAARAKASLEEAQAIAASLAAKPVVVAHKAGADGRLFGTVKADAIAEAIEAAGIGSVDKRTIHLGSAIKRTGEYKVAVRLHADVVANVVLDVVAAS
ncbi:MAG: 50S ribosomal protein L9 [Rothia mucilaginosa]|uniref:50S ribosomal protein L9 n=1 Tax=Rothia mucilaginosa TaxID=43675 RepID=UPI001D3DB671|nr:50S ribosomal protein L9 [Rothia mucilaginosa]MBS6433226.1 50S ribosomal protein L9 [Rothia mucilaginosa]